MSAGLTLEQLASLARVSRSTLVKIESGATPDPGFAVVSRLLHNSGATNLSITQLHERVMTMWQPRLVGVGYEGLSVDDLVERLRAMHVSVVADVRRNPNSRKPGLSKTALGTHLRTARIEYHHFPCLGNPKANRAAYADPGDDTPRDQFRQLLNAPSAQEDLARLRALAKTEVVGVLCFEADETLCHRQQVLTAAAASD